MVNMGWPVLTTSLKSGEPNTISNQNGPTHLGISQDKNIPCQYCMTNINQHQSYSYGQYGMARIDHINRIRQTQLLHQTKMGHPILENFIRGISLVNNA